jgi:hypothetical protein
LATLDLQELFGMAKKEGPAETGPNLKLTSFQWRLYHLFRQCGSKSKEFVRKNRPQPKNIGKAMEIEGVSY